MNSYLKRIEERMSDDQKDMLRRIWEPTVVGVPLYDSRRDVCVMPDGEIRSYGRLYETEALSGTNVGQAAYLASRDGGLSWTRHYSHGIVNACTYLEKPALYLTVCDTRDYTVGCV